MFRRYHRALTGRANAAVVRNNLPLVFVSMWRDTVIWLIPSVLALLICWIWGLTGTASFLVSVPLVGISLVGGVIYVGTVYAMALNNRQRSDQ